MCNPSLPATAMNRSRISGKALAEITHRNAGELVHSEAAEQPLVRLKYADDFIQPSVEAHLFADRIHVGEQRIGDRAPDDDHVARVFLVVSAR